MEFDDELGYALTGGREMVKNALKNTCTTNASLFKNNSNNNTNNNEKSKSSKIQIVALTTRKIHDTMKPPSQQEKSKSITLVKKKSITPPPPVSAVTMDMKNSKHSMNEEKKPVVVAVIAPEQEKEEKSKFKAELQQRQTKTEKDGSKKIKSKQPPLLMQKKITPSYPTIANNGSRKVYKSLLALPEKERVPKLFNNLIGDAMKEIHLTYSDPSHQWIAESLKELCSAFVNDVIPKAVEEENQRKRLMSEISEANERKRRRKNLLHHRLSTGSSNNESPSSKSINNLSMEEEQEERLVAANPKNVELMAKELNLQMLLQKYREELKEWDEVENEINQQGHSTQKSPINQNKRRRRPSLERENVEDYLIETNKRLEESHETSRILHTLEAMENQIPNDLLTHAAQIRNILVGVQSDLGKYQMKSRELVSEFEQQVFKGYGEDFFNPMSLVKSLSGAHAAKVVN